MTEEDRIKIQQTMQELAAQILRQEQTAPGVQDPDLVRWATNKLSSNPAPPAPVSSPPPSPAPQPPAASPSQSPAPIQLQPAADTGEEEGVLRIQQPGQTIQPSAGQQNNGSGSNFTQDNGER